jgi:hypothetical protein
LGREISKTLIMPVGGAIREGEVLALGPAILAQRIEEPWHSSVLRVLRIRRVACDDIQPTDADRAEWCRRRELAASG